MPLRLRLGNKEDYMKLKYEKPLLEVENYELDTSIASNCRMVSIPAPSILSMIPVKITTKQSVRPCRQLPIVPDTISISTMIVTATMPPAVFSSHPDMIVH